MKKITLFYLTGCPYCHHAKRAVSELTDENPVYNGISIDWVEERENAALANQYDYYYVPTIFQGKTKLYEADPSEDYASVKKNIMAAFDTVLAGE